MTTANLTDDQIGLFESVTDTAISLADTSSIAKTSDYVFEMAEMTVTTERELEQLENSGFSHIAEKLRDLESALCIHDFAKSLS